MAVLGPRPDAAATALAPIALFATGGRRAWWCLRLDQAADDRLFAALAACPGSVPGLHQRGPEFLQRPDGLLDVADVGVEQFQDPAARLPAGLLQVDDLLDLLQSQVERAGLADDAQQGNVVLVIRCGSRPGSARAVG
jgi:hypothetical protein